MVREDEIGAASVDVDARTEIPARHGRALDVPSRPSRSIRRVPGRLVLNRLLPEHEVERIAFVWVVRGVPPLVGDGQHLITRDVAELAELLITAHRKVDVAAALVGVPLFHESLDDLE